MTLRLSILTLLTAAASAGAAVAFGPVKNYPNIGLMFPCLDRAKADPLPLPLAHPYLLEGNSGLVREDRFAPFELWYGLACCARWSDPGGNRFVIGRVTHRLPTFDDEEVSRTRFGIAMEDDSALVDPRNPEHVNEWVATFAETPVYKPKSLKLNTLALDGLLVYPCDATNTLIYAFRPRRIGNASSPDWFCVILHAPGVADFDALRDRFEEQFIGQLKLPSRLSKDEGAEAEQLDVSRKGEKPPDQPDHPVRVEARKSVENYDAWWVAETDGYIILSDVDSEIGKSVIRDLQDTMPALRLAFAKLVPPLTREEDVSLIRLFQSKDDFVRHVGKDNAWSSGVWMPGRRELVLAQESGKEEMMRIIRHEAFHQYLSQAYCMLAAAPWMNEGHACLFENASVSAKGKVTLNEDVARCTLLLEHIEQATALLPQLISADYEGFYAGEDIQRTFKYAAAWGLAYYLQKGAPQERNTTYKEILPAFASALAETHRYPDATALAFESVDMGLFQENFREFWQKRRAEARLYDPLEK